MGPAEEFEEYPPSPEPHELRGPMDRYPNYAVHPPLSLASRLEKGLEEKGDLIIQLYPERLGGVQWTASAHLEHARQLARGLVSWGLAPGDTVCFLCSAHPEYGPIFLATLLAGATFAPLNPRFDDGDLRRLLEVLSPRLVIAIPEVAPHITDLLESSEMQPPPQVIAISDNPDWNALLTADEATALPAPAPDMRAAVAIIACSSGSTGLPKGVMTSHAALHASLDMFSHPKAHSNKNSTLLFTSPAFWVTGIWFTLQSMVEQGMSLVYECGANEEQFLEAIETYKPSIVFTGNNFLLSAAKCHEMSDPRRDISSVKIVLTGGAALSQEADVYIQDMLPNVNLLSVYGMTELNTGIGLSLVGPRKMGSVGKLCPHLRCKVVDIETGCAVGPNQPGELRFKGPSLTCGYLKNPKATAELFDAHGWLRSGDVGFYDEEGFFYVTGRIKDNMKYLGHHVSPVELEGLIETHPAVLESAVVGVPDPMVGERPRAYVVLRPGASVTAEELEALVRENLAEHKWLRGGVVFLDALPKSATGKISRAEIRKLFVKPIQLEESLKSPGSEMFYEDVGSIEMRMRWSSI